jgi:hypothetical protein
MEWDGSRTRGDGRFRYATQALPADYLVVALQAGMRQIVFWWVANPGRRDVAEWYSGEAWRKFRRGP